MVHQAIIRLPSLDTPDTDTDSNDLVSSLCIEFEQQCTVSDLKHQLVSHLVDSLGMPASSSLSSLHLIHNGQHLQNNDMLSDTLFMSNQDTTVFMSALFPLLGGKGGFGSMLKAQGGRMASKKSTNFESCRDLSGRRLKAVHEAKYIIEYLEKEPERKRKREEEKIQKLEKILNVPAPTEKKILFDDIDYLETHDKTLEDVKETIHKVLQGKQKEKKSETVKKIWGQEETDDSDEDESEEEEQVAGCSSKM